MPNRVQKALSVGVAMLAIMGASYSEAAARGGVVGRASLVRTIPRMNLTGAGVLLNQQKLNRSGLGSVLPLSGLSSLIFYQPAPRANNLESVPALGVLPAGVDV